MNTSAAAVVLRTEHLGRRVGEKWIVNDVSLASIVENCWDWSAPADRARVPCSVC